MKENITVLRNGGLLIMSEIDMRRLIIAGNAYFGIHDKAGENIGAQLSWLNDCILNRPETVAKQFVIVL